MREITFPVAGAVVRMTLPMDVPVLVIVKAVRVAISAGAAQMRKGNLKFPGPMGRSIVEQRITLFRTDAGAYERQESRDRDVLARAAEVGIRRDEPDAGTVLDVMLTGKTYTETGAVDLDLADWIGEDVADWARLVIGHKVLAHDDECRPCRIARSRQWLLVLAHTGASPRLILDLYAAAVAAGAMPDFTRPISGRVHVSADFLAATGTGF